MKFLKGFGIKFKHLKDSVDDWRNRDDNESKFSEQPKASRIYTINCTGDACKGDRVLFFRRIWERISVNAYGKKANSVTGYDIVEGEIVRDSYGETKQQHTFSLLLPDKTTIMIKGRNLYAVGTWRKKWKDETERVKCLEEKHGRGKNARKKRSERGRNG